MLPIPGVALVGLVMLWLGSATVLAQAPARARTDNGREVILRGDGTWSFADQPAEKAPAAPRVAPAPPPAQIPPPQALSPPPTPPVASQNGARPAVAPPPVSLGLPSVRSLVTPPSANPPPPAAPSGAATVTPGAGPPAPPQQPAVLAPPVASKSVTPVSPAVSAPVQAAGLPPIVQRPAASTAVMDTRRGRFRIWYNPAIWQPQPATADGRVEFRQTNGQAVVVVIPEGTPLPLVALRTAAVENAKRSAPDARIVTEQGRKIGSRDILWLQINATLTSGQLPVVYVGHYFGDPQGSIQVVGAVAERDFDRARQQIQEFLDGLDLNRP